MKQASSKPIKVTIFFFFTIILLSNCTSNNSSSTPFLVSTNSPTPSPKVIITQTSKPKSDQTQTAIVTAPVIAPVVELNQQCDELTTSTQSNQIGTLLFQKNFGDPLLFLDLKTGNQKFVPSDQKMQVLDAGVSLNSRWLLYELDPNDGSSEYNFMLTDASGITQKELPVDGWNVSKIFWLNNSVIRVAEPNNEVTYITNFAFDPFRNAKTSLQSDFPSIRGRGVDWRIDKIALSLGVAKGTNIIYDPTLTKAIYPRSGTSGSVSLFDLETNQEIRNINSSGNTGLPKWAPTGELFSVVETTSTALNGVNDEFVIYSSDALEVMRLRYTRQEFGAMRIENYSWSPDGTRIALWINVNGEPISSASTFNLAVLDILTNKSNHYCISGLSSLQFEEVFERYTTTANLIWSPESNQILFARNKDRSQETENVIVDLTNNTVYKVIEDTEPIGWMTNTQ